MRPSTPDQSAGLLVVIVAALWAVTVPASAQPPAATNSVTGQVGAPPRTFVVRNQDFDSWCQMTQSYPRERCDARRKEDLDAFDNFRLTVERYEVEFLQRRERDRAALERMNRDPTATERNLQVAPIR